MISLLEPSTLAPPAPHLTIGLFYILREAFAIHKRRPLHARPQGAAQFLEPGQVNGQPSNHRGILLWRFGRQFLEAKIAQLA